MSKTDANETILPAIPEATRPLWLKILLRALCTAVVLGLWFWTQSLLGARTSDGAGIGDGLHQLTAGLNDYFTRTPRAANMLLIASSALIDALGLFLLCRWLLGGSVRPFLGLFLLMILRQAMQSLCALPAPPHIIWRYPGFPSVLVTYGVATDFFFSGHTAIAVFSATELGRFRRNWLSAVAILIVLFEISTVIVLRAHYTMDVFTGIVAALWVGYLCEQIAPRIDSWLPKAA